MQQLLQEGRRSSHSISSAARSWISSVGLTLAVGIAYFLAALLSLALLTKPDGVAVFWPAAGIASGTLIALGSGARLPVTVGVVVATVTANILGDRNLPAGLVFALCNAGEALLIGWLIERNSGARFSLDSVQRVLSFLLAVVIGVTVSGIGGTVGFALFHSSSTPLLMTWFNWFVSDALGVLVAAPMFIGLGHLRRDPPKRRELAEGTLTLVVLAAATVAAFTSATHAWYTLLPLGLLLPILLAAHCRPVFAAAATLILGFAVVSTTTFGIGEFGDPIVNFADRVHGARATLLAMSICTLILAALFAERRHKEAALKGGNDRLSDSNSRLQLALDCAQLGTWSLHLKSGRFENDVRDRHIHGHGPDAPPQNLAQMRSEVHPDDISNLDLAFAGLGRADDRCRTEYRLAPRTDHERAGRERWVAIEGEVVRDATGRPVQLLGVTRDITEHKHAEARLQEGERRLRDLLGALPAAIYVTDAVGRITYCNEGAIKLWGAKPRLEEDRWSDLARFYYADGTPMALEDCPTEIALKQRRAVRGQEAILERADGTRVPIIPFPTPLRDHTGAVVGVVNMSVDISERKQAEQALTERNLQLGLAGKFALVGTYTYDVESEKYRISPGYAAIHGLPEGTEETSRAEWRTRVHPSDLPAVEAGFQQAMTERRRDYYCEYRYLRPGGEIRWIDSRNFISYDCDGVARLVGANIDITQRKETEAALDEHKASLADALAAGEVMAFDWDAVTGQSRRSGNAALIFGVEQDWADRSRRNDFLGRVHPDDRISVKKQIRQLCPRSPSYALIFRFCCPNGEQVWLEETAKGEFDPAGRLLRIKGLTRNISRRKKAELVLEERNVQLALAAKTGLVGSFAYDTDTEIMQISEGYAAIHDLPERTTEIARSECLTALHPDDIARVNLFRSEAFCKQRREYNVEYRIIRPGGELRWVETRCFLSYSDRGQPRRVVGVSIDITEHKRTEEHLQAMNAELDHRVKNVLATASAVAGQTLTASSSMEHFVSAFDGRLRSMAQTHELLSEQLWRGVPLAELLRRELAPYAGGNNTEINGPEVILTAEAGQTLAMVFHELATNAAKYGALSSREGKVSVDWRRQLNGSVRAGLVIEWQETGGPSAKAESKASYGTSIIRELIPHELAGKVNHVLTPEGARCRLEIPGRWIDASSPVERTFNWRHEEAVG